MVNNKLVPATMLSDTSAFFMRVDVNDIISMATTVFGRVAGEFSDHTMTTWFRNLNHLIASGIDIVNERSIITERNGE
jgi:hypothetical protein